MLQNAADNKVGEARISVKTGRKHSIEAILYNTSIMREGSRAEQDRIRPPDVIVFLTLVRFL
jgi:hypothetical protein